MDLHLSIEDGTSDPDEAWDTATAQADDDLRAELASEAREYEWQMRRYCDDG